jgi:ABC-type polysaccharide/polyol phosphate export permease
MGFKVNFFARPIDSNYRLAWESFLIEFSLFVICTIMAIYGWNNGSLLMAVPAAVVAVSCFGLVIYSLFNFFANSQASK